jgi:hypothetical protein
MYCDVILKISQKRATFYIFILEKRKNKYIDNIKKVRQKSFYALMNNM